MEKNQPTDWLADLPVRTENIGFKTEEMIRCAKCARTNPPNRLKCLYCGGELEISAALESELLQPKLRKLENWEKGFNVILLSAARLSSETNFAEASRLLKIEKDVLHKIIASGSSLPAARAESSKEAEIIQARLGKFGFETRVVSDESLAIEKLARRLRGIEFAADRLILMPFNQGETVEVKAEDLNLIVTGAIFERRISATEQYNKKGDNKILDTSETANDELLIDFFSRRNSIGWRVHANGFDFSALGSDKEMLAKNNFVKLAEKLRGFAPDVKFVDDYAANRHLLAGVWEVEQKTDSQGLKREGVGKFNIGSITTVNNLSQFTKYSRLQWHLL